MDTMANDPELDGKYLGTISGDFVKVADFLKEANYQIRKRNFSEYPIFPISKVQIPIGQLLYGRKDLGLSWNYYASFLEELLEREIIDSEKAEIFKNSFKDPDEFCCLFVVDEKLMSFVYIPYPED